MVSTSIDQLLNTLPQVGKVTWIGLRPERRVEMLVVNSVEAMLGQGLVGDRYAGRSGKREVTLIQAEHLAAIASLVGLSECSPTLLRRNIVVAGLNLLALKDKHFWVGESKLEFAGLCHPCSFMEETLGNGGYNAVRGHGGITARVLESGLIKLGDSVTAITQKHT